jgi:hypothetical protein
MIFTCHTLKEKYNYKLAGVRPPSYHLGGNFYRDKDGTLAWGEQSYIKKMLSNYILLLGEPPKEYSSPMEDKDYPKIDLTPELDPDGIRVYQSLIFAVQWAVTLGCFDILMDVTTMASFRVAPRQGHREHLKRLYGYLRRQLPNHEATSPPVEYYWIHSIYGPNT